tara:strand:+ start:488 stop:892 length:405 start_codon:yes stop_codon:yes gene_type:complete
MKNNKLEKVNELRGIMLGLEMNLKLLDDDLDEVVKNLIHLHKIESDLVYNIKLHKSGKVITVAKEYRRSIDELKIIKEEIIKHKNNKDMIQKKMEKKLKAYDYYLSEYEQAFDDLNSEKVILLFRKDKDEQKED